MKSELARRDVPVVEGEYESADDFAAAENPYRGFIEWAKSQSSMTMGAMGSASTSAYGYARGSDGQQYGARAMPPRPIFVQRKDEP
jgi:hypothetical protein